MEETGQSDGLVEGSLEVAQGDDQARALTRPNVLIVFNDQLRADVCGVYGGQNITTPNIDRLAKEGIVFTNSVSTCPLCTP
jgi:arylsulfatase A-like enzyme